MICPEDGMMMDTFLIPQIKIFWFVLRRNRLIAICPICGYEQ